MTVETRAARRDEFPAVRDVICHAMKAEDEGAMWEYLVAFDPALRPEGVRVAVAGGRPVACAVVLPRRVRTRTGWVDGAEMTLVACHPDYQGRGYGGAAVRDALAYMAGAGLALAVFYGVPEFYPRFGCAPVLPSLGTFLPVPEASGPPLADGGTAASGGVPGGGGSTLVPATEADLPALTELYDEQVAAYPCAVGRTAEPWLWRVRNPDAYALLTLPDRLGYAFVSWRAEEADYLLVLEAAARGADAARRVLAGLMAEARSRKLARLRILMPPDHVLARLARVLGAEQVYRPASAGMAAVTRWSPLLPPGYQVVARRRAARADGGRDLDAVEGLARGGRLVLRADRRALTQLVLGYRGVDDLLLAGAAELAGRRDGQEPVSAASEDHHPEGTAADSDALRRDFPALFPRYAYAPFYYWFF